MRTAIAVSGKGTLLEAMIKDGFPIRLVFADRPCRGLEIADEAGLNVELICRKNFSKSFDREAYTLRVISVLRSHSIQLVAMAGFMTVFHEVMFTPGNFPGRVINTHPSLLPLFKGDHAVRDALAARAKETGCTIHIATAELDDGGHILAQERVAVLQGDSEATLHERIKVVERRLYPATLRKFIAEQGTKK